jgi:hypothetical protein
MGHPPIRIEVMNEIDGVTFEECRPAAILAYLDGIQVPIISLADASRNFATICSGVCRFRLYLLN